MSYVRLDIGNMEEARAKVREAFHKQYVRINEIKERVSVKYAKSNKTRKVFAVDSGFNRAYETTFTLLKAAVVNEEMEVDYCEGIYLFHVDNYQTERLKRLLMQKSLYEALAKTVQSGKADESLVLVDGTITLTVFYPTLRDGKEYRRYFRDFYERLYSPLLDQCLKRDILVLGFLKRTGSTYLADHLKIKGTYDIYIMNSLLRGDGQYLGPVPVIDANANRVNVHHRYVTFYLNLRNWNYRFELLKEQQSFYQECMENLLYMATEAHHGMTPVFSKADEYARVTRREAELKFDYLVHQLDPDERIRLRLGARKRTHFGYSSKRASGRLTER